MKAFTLKLAMKQECPLLTLFFNMILETNQSTQAKEEMTRVQMRRKKIKLSLLQII